MRSVQCSNPNCGKLLCCVDDAESKGEYVAILCMSCGEFTLVRLREVREAEKVDVVEEMDKIERRESLEEGREAKL